MALKDMIEHRTFFIGLIGAPYASDLFTTAVRLAAAAVGQGHHVTVWTCGYATALTQRGMGQTKPRNPWAWEPTTPSTAARVQRLLGSSDGRLDWLVCGFCAQERGAVDQIPQVRVRPPSGFVRRADAADVCLVLGIK